MNEVLRYLNNYFFKFKETGSFIISENKLKGIRGNYITGQYILITGSTMNDRVVKVNNIDLDGIMLEKANNEEFEGVIYSLNIPANVIELVERIKEFKENNKPSDKASENFEGYSYSKSTKNGKTVTWKDVFFEELKLYRQMYDGKQRVAEFEGERIVTVNALAFSDGTLILDSEGYLLVEEINEYYKR